MTGIKDLKKWEKLSELAKKLQIPYVISKKRQKHAKTKSNQYNKILQERKILVKNCGFYLRIRCKYLRARVDKISLVRR